MPLPHIFPRSFLGVSQLRLVLLGFLFGFLPVYRYIFFSACFSQGDFAGWLQQTLV